jgi:hypothetical protein
MAWLCPKLSLEAIEFKANVYVYKLDPSYFIWTIIFWLNFCVKELLRFWSHSCNIHISGLKQLNNYVFRFTIAGNEIHSDIECASYGPFDIQRLNVQVIEEVCCKCKFHVFYKFYTNATITSSTIVFLDGHTSLKQNPYAIQCNHMDPIVLKGGKLLITNNMTSLKRLMCHLFK